MKSFSNRCSSLLCQHVIIISESKNVSFWKEIFPEMELVAHPRVADNFRGYQEIQMAVQFIFLPPYPGRFSGPVMSTPEIHVAYLTKDIEGARSGRLCMCNERLHGCRKFRFREGNFNFVSGWRHISIRESDDEVRARWKRMGRLLIKNTKERGRCLKCVSRESIYTYIWDKGIRLLQDGNWVRKWRIVHSLAEFACN